MCRSLSDKLKDSDFLNVICKYDIICLYECWNESTDITIPNYVTYCVKREHGKGGGIVIFIKDYLKDYCYCIETVCDSIVILKIVGNHENGIKDIYVFVNYIPPLTVRTM